MILLYEFNRNSCVQNQTREKYKIKAFLGFRCYIPEIRPRPEEIRPWTSYNTNCVIHENRVFKEIKMQQYSSRRNPTVEKPCYNTNCVLHDNPGLKRSKCTHVVCEHIVLMLLSSDILCTLIWYVLGIVSSGTRWSSGGWAVPVTIPDRDVVPSTDRSSTRTILKSTVTIKNSQPKINLITMRLR